MLEDENRSSVGYNEEMFEGRSNEERNETIKNAVEELNRKLPNYKKILKIKLRSTEFEKTTAKKIKRTNLGADAQPEADAAK